MEEKQQKTCISTLCIVPNFASSETRYLFFGKEGNRLSKLDETGTTGIQFSPSERHSIWFGFVLFAAVLRFGLATGGLYLAPYRHSSSNTQ
jgi:hypothetical protein